jgi:hypothetical protein
VVITLKLVHVFVLNESYHECGLLGQLDRRTTNWLVLGSFGMTGTNDCSHGMTESLMTDLGMFYIDKLTLF